ncbi:RHS repeat-associated core domain-containing protein [Chryseobacterium indologenes]|uniref:RHS repeat-associated core domain-containing protein n=1 Tax=Chryseobacterium indologenes TaxID=253 RepID=A0A411DIV6_CHRID|nr:RHS repeat-associated core domain-containing protein [Chryseobacterium indologenes]
MPLLHLRNYTDQVGNIRLAYYKDASGNLKIDRTTNYYPFELEFGGELSTANSITPNYKYSTHGKEKQQETGWSDFGTRMYMSDIGRWGVPDPLSEKFTGVSSYNYVLNNPLRYVDPDGNAPVDWIRQTVNGKSTWTYNANVKTTSQALAAGYKNVEGVYSSARISSNGFQGSGYGGYGFTLNTNGSVTNLLSGTNVYNTFVTDAGTTVNAPEFTSIGQWNKDFIETLAGSDNFFAKLGYNMVNDAYVTAQVFDGGLLERPEWENPLGGNYGNLDGTPNYNQANGFANTLATAFSFARGAKPVTEAVTQSLNFGKLNAAQFSSTFKGTIVSRAAPATRGLLNRYLNKGTGLLNGQMKSGTNAATAVKVVGGLFKPEEEKKSN